MKLNSLLSKKKAAILERWFQSIFETYPTESAQFLKNGKNPFSNPVGYTVNQDLEKLYDELLTGLDRDKISPLIEYFIKIRSVQDFSPSQAVAFIFQLKKAIREVLKAELGEPATAGQLFSFESRLDEVCLMVFDAYMQNREKLFEIRTKQIRAGTFKLLDRVNQGKGKQNEDRKCGES
jgi:hypothetical protein